MATGPLPSLSPLVLWFSLVSAGNTTCAEDGVNWLQTTHLPTSGTGRLRTSQGGYAACTACSRRTSRKLVGTAAATSGWRVFLSRPGLSTTGQTRCSVNSLRQLDS